MSDRALMQQALDALNQAAEAMPFPVALQVRSALRARLAQPESDPDPSRCPKCGGEADNGHDRCDPPNPYHCTKCMAQPEPEPVAWYLPSPDGDDSIFRDHRTILACDGNKWDGFLPLYTRPTPGQQDVAAWADKAMELATDFSVESLRLGSYERKDVYENSCRASWQTIDLRHKREAARERLRQHLYTAPPARQWVDLTDEEAFGVFTRVTTTWTREPPGFLPLRWREFARAISEALRKKNGGTE